MRRLVAINGEDGIAIQELPATNGELEEMAENRQVALNRRRLPPSSFQGELRTIDCIGCYRLQIMNPLVPVSNPARLA